MTSNKKINILVSQSVRPLKKLTEKEFYKLAVKIFDCKFCKDLSDFTKMALEIKLMVSQSAIPSKLHIADLQTRAKRMLDSLYIKDGWSE